MYNYKNIKTMHLEVSQNCQASYITTPYGNISDTDISFPIEYTTCTKYYCGCGADISISKYRI
jgi:hypothetical protein